MNGSVLAANTVNSLTQLVSKRCRQQSPTLEAVTNSVLFILIISITMKKEKTKRVSLWLVTATLAVSMAVLGLHACKKTDENKSLRISVSGQETPIELMPQKMSEIYYNVHHERQLFDSCKVIEQDNGYTILVAYGTDEENQNVKFAVLVNKVGDKLSVRTTPGTTCTCTGTCQSGCNPEPLETGEWICTDCEPWPHSLPNCYKKVIATNPGTGSNQ